jgi:Ca-activated chloride channel homolog
MMRPVSLLLLAGVSTFLGGEAHRRTEKGNRAYLDGKNDEAITDYQKAQTVVPEAPQLHYDLGNVLYRQENWAGAAEAYERALGAAGPDLAPRAAYNLGNALFKDEKYDDAVKAYMRALKAAPADADAKHNLEMALRALEEQKQQPKQQPKDQKQQPKDQDKKEQQPPSGGDDKKPDDKGPKSGDDQKDDQKKKDDGKQQPKPGGMTPQEAQKLLDRLNDQERQNLKRQQARPGKGPEPTPEKDW